MQIAQQEQIKTNKNKRSRVKEIGKWLRIDFACSVYIGKSIVELINTNN